jgi:uncharacterized protein involved in exopolysaccharide biosynthesis
MTYHEILNTILFYKTRILKVTIIATVLIFLILLYIYPVTYDATVTVLPPEKEESMGGLGSLLSGQSFTSLLSGGYANASSQLYSEILKSRSVEVYVINKLNLINYFHSKNVYEAARKLDKVLHVEISQEGIISLSVDISTPYIPMVYGNTDSTKKLAAAVSNSFIEGLDRINHQKLSSKAKKARIYIGQQIKITRAKLDSVETALMLFQKENKAVSLPDQVSAAIDAASKLKSEIVKTEVNLGLMQTSLKEDNKTLIALKDKLTQLKDQYNKMEMGSQDYLLAFKDVPELGKDLANLLREVKIQNEVYLMLQQQYYQEKIQENREVPTVQVLDEAIPPERASSPRLIFSSVLGGFFVFLFMSFVCIVTDKKLLPFKKRDKKSV